MASLSTMIYLCARACISERVTMAGKKPNPGTPADQRKQGKGKKPGPDPKKGGK